MKNIIFIAPPAAGKGTQSDILVNNYQYIHISTGDLLRDAIEKNTEIGNKVKDIMESGQLVCDEIIFTLLQEKLKCLKEKPFILDGVPRNLEQAKKLTEIFKTIGVDSPVVIYIDVPESLALERSLGRVSCKNCKRTYNVYLEGLKPKEEGICDYCKTPLEKRSDDNEASFKKRFEIYVENVTPVLDYYKSLGILEVISKEFTEKYAIASKIEEIVKGND